MKSTPIAKGIEEGYKTLLMMHRFPFCVLHFNMDTTALDVNIHPNKMQVRIDGQEEITKLLAVEVREALISKNLIPDAALVKREERTEKISAPEPFEKRRIANDNLEAVLNEAASASSDVTEKVPAVNANVIRESVSVGTTVPDVKSTVLFNDKENAEEEKAAEIKRAAALNQSSGEFRKEITYFEDELKEKENKSSESNEIKETGRFADMSNPTLQNVIVEKPDQYTLFENDFFTEESKEEFEVIGQVFDTYWIIALKDKFYYMDQHAAHEKVKFEEFMKKFHEGKLQSQNLLPPCVIQLKPSEYRIFDKNRDAFEKLSFEIDDFGQDALAMRAIPTDLFGFSPQELFMDIMEELSTVYSAKNVTTVEEQIATRACKAAIKGNTVLSKESAKMLIEKLFTLENPYQCPHGRPTLVAVSKDEMEKLFKRIV